VHGICGYNLTENLYNSNCTLILFSSFFRVVETPKLNYILEIVTSSGENFFKRREGSWKHEGDQWQI